ncbi:acylphosphatase [Allobacillus sp. GCM10007491]|uniref:acylphosphatase n=1 Tax=Allobacillus saliphilus TaxID=2912308 RepID=A0A941CVH2_9BACI|nr:acylphosphatase [Allobacillus saliphilus]MBR7554758.1 acylphosphatase [Allobacillus saliphilus]
MNSDWLPHLKDCVPSTISGDRLSIYSIALEGWRRGLTLKFYGHRMKRKNKLIIRYSLTDDSKEVNFSYSTGPDVTQEARKICSSKMLTKEQLDSANVPTPSGRRFEKEVDIEQIIDYANSVGFPVVIKPSAGKMGNGVVPNIQNGEELKQAVYRVREVLGYNRIILEKHIVGDEYRVYVIGEQVIAAMNRIPANVKGNGKDTIRDLIKNKNSLRKSIPSVRRRPIKIDYETKRSIKQSGYKLDSILEKDKILYLKKTSNISAGGDPVDSTDVLPNHIKEIAINAVKAIPGLSEGGVDLIYDEKTNEGNVIEVNTNVGIGGHLFPLRGKARDIPKALIDYYFPETQSKVVNEYLGNIYFDFTKVTTLIRDGVLNEFTLPSLNYQTFIGKKFDVYGNVQGVNFRNWVKRNANFLGLSGTVKNMSDGSVEVIAFGCDKNINELKELFFTGTPRKVNVDEIKEYDWKEPTELGFSILENVN